MKKVVLFLLVFTSVFVLNACQSEESIAQDKIQAAIEHVGLDDKVLDHDYAFITEYDGVDITYESQNHSLLLDSGKQLPMLNHAGNQGVMVEAVFSYEGFEETHEYEVFIQPYDAIDFIDTQTVAFENIATEYQVDDSTIDLFTSNRDITYVPLMAYLDLLDGAITRERLDVEVDGEIVTISFTEQNEEDYLEDETYELIIDFSDNTATVSEFDFFSSFSAETDTDFGVGLEIIDYEVERFEATTFDFNQYRIELFEDDGTFYMPLELANLFFSGSMYDTYYNQEVLYGVDTYQISDRFTLQTLKGEATELSNHLMRASYHHLFFTLDYFYGLKEDQNVESYETRLNAYADTMLSESTHYDAIFKAVYALDDLHTSYLLNGPFSEALYPQLTLNDLGSRTRNYLNEDERLSPYCNTLDDMTVLSDGKTAMISLKEFSEDTPIIMQESVDEIIAHGGIENVIVNLACNGGGVIGTAWQTIGYLTDEPFMYHAKNTGDDSQFAVSITSENPKLDVEWYVLQSKNTFSAANLFSSMAKDDGLATIIGEQSRGGAASITTNILPSGSILMMSSDNLLTNNQYESIEFGITPDIEIPFNNYKDLELLVQYFE